eukprot:c580_g1_i1.p1 GENE.c580_g1_i1~~c580_g1_i1.p1  ORF type:complete len:870 (+),score=31.02 c580_g1_i1:49-2610(+)
MNKFAIFVLILAVVIVIRNRTRVYENSAHFLKENGFAYKVPGAFSIFLPALSSDPESLILPSGELWPAPATWYDLTPTWLVTAFTKILSMTPRLAQKYEPDLFQYRILQAGLGYSKGGLDPGAYQNLLTDISKATTCKDKLKAKIALAYNIFHTGENYDLQVRNLEDLCDVAEYRNCIGLTETCRSMSNAGNTFDRWVREMLSMTYFRYAEEENCREGHTHESCLFPLKGSAIHKKEYGSKKAIEMLQLQLTMDPTQLAAKWTLNIAYMTLGTYPNAVPKQWLIDPKVLASDIPFPEFPNIAGGLNLDEMSSMGNVIMDDFIGNDGLLDIFTCAAAYNFPVHLYHNKGDGQFVEVSQSTGGLVGVGGGANCKQGDFNNDGNLDIYIIRGGWVNLEHPNSLLMNLGNGTWKDVTYELFPVVSYYASHSAAFFDVDKDGLLDILVANENSKCELWLNQGAGKKFIDIAAKAGVKDCGLVKGLDFGDYNNDGWQDIYFSRYGTKNLLMRNNGDNTFTDVTVAANVIDPTLSFPVGFYDFNQDGHEDIYVAGHLFEAGDAVLNSYTGEHYFRHDIIEARWGAHQKESRLYINNGDGTFTDYAHTSKLSKVRMSMAINFGDVDQDGLPDIYHGTGQPDLRALQPNRLLRNKNGTFFQDVTTDSRTGSLQKGHGISMADLDNDGDLDIYTNIGGAFYGDYFRNALFLNPGWTDTDWIQIEVRGVKENYFGVGARVKVSLKSPNSDGRQHFYRTVGNGASYGANTLRVHTGLGKGNGGNVVSVEILWPRTMSKQVFENVPVNKILRIVENKSDVEVMNYKTTKFDVERLTHIPEHPAGCPHHAAAAGGAADAHSHHNHHH